MLAELTDLQKSVLAMIEEVYTDGVDAIGTPEYDENDNLHCDFRDGEKLLEVTIYFDRDENDIEIKMKN